MQRAAGLARLGAQHLLGEIADPLFVRSHGRLDLTKPRRVYGILNERCNLRCQGCHYWRLRVYQSEMSAIEWMAVLGDLKSFLGAYHVNFSGGEPLLRRDLVDILGYCRDSGIHAGLTTSGVILRDRQARELVEARLFNLNISLDGATAATHDAQRGVRGAYDKAMRAIRLMRNHAASIGAQVPIVLKPTVSRLNLCEMPALVRLAESMGCSVLFQPVSDWGTPETPSLWIDDFDRLRVIIAELVELRASGSPVLNAREQIEDWVRHFERRPKTLADGSLGCSVGLDTLIINPNGDVHNCDRWAALGNIRRDSIRRIWHGSKAQRAKALTCGKGCTENCTTHRSISQRVRGAIHLLHAQESRVPPAPDRSGRDT
jgi:radical SAM protein with 4Fe4S-binding SPASM domain